MEKRVRHQWSPLKGKTPTKTIRVPDSLWNEVKKKAAEEKVTVTSVILFMLNEYVSKTKE